MSANDQVEPVDVAEEKAEEDNAEEDNAEEDNAEEEAPKEEDEEKPKKSPKEKKAPKEKKEASTPARKSTRERKEINVYVPVTNEKENKPLEVPDGTGTEISEIENVMLRLKDTKAVDPILRKVHTLLYPGQRGVKLNIKKNIKQFKGFPEDDKIRARCDKLLSTFEVGKHIKPICLLFDLETTGTKDDLTARIIEWVFDPQESGNAYRKNAGKKRKASTKKKKPKKKASKKKDGPKRVSAYMMFCNVSREKAKKKHPDAKFSEMGKILGKMWGKLDDDEKEEWKSKAVKAKESSASPKKKQKTSKKKAKKAESSEEESEEEEEEEESDEDAPLAMKAPGLGEKIESKIKEIMANTGLEDLTIKKIKAQLVEDFGQDLVTNKKAEIKEFVHKLVQG